MDAHERLVAAMPTADELRGRRIAPWELERRVLAIREPGGAAGTPAYLCCDLAGGADDTCYFGYSAADYEHEYFSWFLRIWAIDPPGRRMLPAAAAPLYFEEPFFQGVCDLGAVWISYYVEGADLGELRRAGVEVSWAAARCVHAAARAPLAGLHARRVVHGGLSPSRIRLALSQEPYHRRDLVAPIRFCCPRGVVGDATAATRELAELAAAVGMLSHHPDPEIDALLRDPSPDVIAVLTDLLLERGEPVDELLADHLRGSPATAAAAAALIVESYADTDAIQAELEALWRRVVELCVLMR